MCVGALVAGLAGMRAQGHSRAAALAETLGASAVEVGGAPPAETRPADPWRQPLALAPAPVRPYVASADSVESPRDRWRRRRWNGYRYPYPIPTPADWRPPDGPIRIALQAGHWRADEAPPELEGLKDNGTSFGGRREWQVNLEIAQRAAEMLARRGYVVDVLPAVVPPGYRAHLFISIHADGSADSHASGYRVAFARRDATGRAAQIAELLERSYGEATGLRLLPDVTRRMRGYYAFNFRRYEHALHPMTIGVIIETGYLTSGHDRRVIVADPDRAARGIVAAVIEFPETPPPIPVVPAEPPLLADQGD